MYPSLSFTKISVHNNLTIYNLPVKIVSSNLYIGKSSVIEENNKVIVKMLTMNGVHAILKKMTKSGGLCKCLKQLLLQAVRVESVMQCQ